MSTPIVDPQISYRTDAGWVDGVTGVVTPILGWPNELNVGVAAIDGWEPASVVEEAEGFTYFFEPDGVYEDLRFVDTAVIVRAPRVTFRRCEFVGHMVTNNYGDDLYNGLTLEDCTWRYSPEGVGPGDPAVATAGYTLRRCAISGVTEGIRVSGSNYVLADPANPLGHTVRIYDTYARITGPSPCSAEQGVAYHGDVCQTLDTGLPGGGVPWRIRNSAFYSIDQYTTEQTPGPGVDPQCGGTSCIISGPGHALPLDLDGLICYGAAIPFRLFSGGDVRNLYIVQDSWVFYPLDVPPEGWDIIGDWEAWTCTIDGAGQVDTLVAKFPRDWSTGNQGMLPP